MPRSTVNPGLRPILMYLAPYQNSLLSVVTFVSYKRQTFEEMHREGSSFLMLAPRVPTSSVLKGSYLTQSISFIPLYSSCTHSLNDPTHFLRVYLTELILLPLLSLQVLVILGLGVGLGECPRGVTT